jgi:heme-NO-binding protein
MHGLVNRALQGFLTDTYGKDIWDEVRSQAGLPFDGFESMLHYEDRLTGDTISAAVAVLHKDEASLLEDMGNYLVTHPNLEPLRRLLRFGGDTFFDFLQSLDDLSGRARLAVPDLDMPDLHIRQLEGASFALDVRWGQRGAGSVFLGALRALADDYGTLAFFEAEEAGPGVERVRIDLFDIAHFEGRSFSLGENPI